MIRCTWYIISLIIHINDTIRNITFRELNRTEYDTTFTVTKEHTLCFHMHLHSFYHGINTIQSCEFYL